MGWGCGVNSRGVTVGYSIQAVCAEDGCDAPIDKGLAYCCGGLAGVEGEKGCGRYFCGQHLFPSGRGGQLCESCSDLAEKAMARAELSALLHPAQGDVPTPGFSSMNFVVEWARDLPESEAAIEPAIEVLAEDEWPQQYAAMYLLRWLGVEVEGVGHGDEFRWQVTVAGQQDRIVNPAVKN